MHFLQCSCRPIAPITWGLRASHVDAPRNVTITREAAEIDEFRSQSVLIHPSREAQESCSRSRESGRRAVPEMTTIKLARYCRSCFETNAGRPKHWSLKRSRSNACPLIHPTRGLAHPRLAAHAKGI